MVGFRIGDVSGCYVARKFGNRQSRAALKKNQPNVHKSSKIVYNVCRFSGYGGNRGNPGLPLTSPLGDPHPAVRALDTS
jgi:hypothetical protein